MLARVVQPVKSRLLSVSELSLSVFLRLLLLAKQQNCASPLLLCWWKKEKKGKRGGRKKKVGYTTLTLAPRKVCDTLDSQFAKKLKVFTIILKAGFFAQYTSELLEILFWRFFCFFFFINGKIFRKLPGESPPSPRQLLEKPTSRPWDGKVFFKSDRNSAQRVVFVY